MKFMLLFKPDKAPPPGIHPCRKDLPEMQKLMGELVAKGIVVATEGLQNSETGARVNYDGAKLRVTDGPFAEAKELIAGFAIVEVKSKGEAIEIAKKFLSVAGEGQADVLQVIETS
jgi:hypothetical protein